MSGWLSVSCLTESVQMEIDRKTGNRLCPEYIRTLHQVWVCLHEAISPRNGNLKHFIYVFPPPQLQTGMLFCMTDFTDITFGFRLSHVTTKADCLITTHLMLILSPITCIIPP